MKHLLKMKRLLKPAGIAVTVLALLASVVAGRERPATVAAEPAARIDSRVQLGELDLSKLERAAPGTAPAADPFAPKSFAPPQAQQSATPAKPQAPELPFRYLGKLIEDGKLSVFLANGPERLTVTAGATTASTR
jgi:pyruvate/2-oxoglutarate dehydrogenase complex dihydrolipoamide acyltransferase (E2) component